MGLLKLNLHYVLVFPNSRTRNYGNTMAICTRKESAFGFYANFYIAAISHSGSHTSSKSSGNTQFLTVDLTGRHNASYKIRNTSVVTDIHIS
ncbi:hypothetical protein ALC60_08055 [Trachymyrmex zeteki]|uniref:Uncharacterized protein n=1 Tax=Mycetomoellerius zeteki TaxID=64791 RepID=A0A151WY76_9HYME|nr:hypothetical protein ALC60_08055 [Trachymyrmex zeteki]